MDLTTKNNNITHQFFDSKTEYIFINICLSLIYDKLPSYAYYYSNSDVNNFWLGLENKHFKIIYLYLIKNKYINNKYININNYKIKNEVLNFVNKYFD